MNKLVRGALFSTRAAEEQRERARRRVDAVHLPEGVTDVRKTEAVWDRAAEGFRKHDPDGSKLADVFPRTEN